MGSGDMARILLLRRRAIPVRRFGNEPGARAAFIAQREHRPGPFECDACVPNRPEHLGERTLEAPVPVTWVDMLRRHDAVARAEPGSLERIDAPLVLEGSKLFLARWRQQEIEVAESLRQRAGLPAHWCGWPETRDSMERFVDSRSDGLHHAQRLAVRLGSTRRLSLITGGPGTGKTFVAARIIEAVLETGPHPVLLLAPTGKAAARLQESVRRSAGAPDFTERTRACVAGLAAQTVHSATLRQGGESLRRARLIVVDETSMIDLDRMHALLRLAHPEASIVMLGDAHQLASVEAGSVLGDLVAGIDEPRHPLADCVVKLVKSHRFPDDSPVGRLAAAVNGDRPDEVIDLLRSGLEGVQWIQVGTPAQVVQRALQALDAAGDGARILCGHRRGADGAVRINATIERGRSGGLYADRPILVTVNDDLTGLRNGDTGSLFTEHGQWFADFGGERTRVPVDRLPAHETAYALTIHKTQGSEYPHAVVALPARPSPVLTRELLYTGITRTRRGLTLVASEVSLRAAVSRPIRRSSGLRERLRAAPVT
jgi:exodeoxyribonuclease V alpha subunit